MAQWWDHLMSTPMIDLAWYDKLAAIGLIIAFLGGMIGGVGLLQRLTDRWWRR